MKKLWIASLVFACCNAFAAPAFTGHDFSGVYDCSAIDHDAGKYTSIATFTLVPAQSVGPHSAYSFKLEVPGEGAYTGHAAAQGKSMAVYFTSPDPSAKDYGTAIAAFTKTKAGKWSFTEYYYEPEYKGGNFGTETCVQR